MFLASAVYKTEALFRRRGSLSIPSAQRILHSILLLVIRMVFTSPTTSLHPYPGHLRGCARVHLHTIMGCRGVASAFPLNSSTLPMLLATLARKMKGLLAYGLS